MKMIYIDDSGDLGVKERSSKNFVLGGDCLCDAGGGGEGRGGHFEIPAGYWLERLPRIQIF